MTRRRPAFTLIEVLVVSMIIGILAITMAVSFSGSRENAKHNSNKDEIYNFFQKARGLSFNSVFVNGSEELDYYLMTVGEDEMTLVAVGTGSETEEVASVDVADDLMITFENYYEGASEITLYYFPPYGTLCFQDDLSGCDEKPTWATVEVGDTIYVELISENGEEEYNVVFSIDKHGGFVEIEE